MNFLSKVRTLFILVAAAISFLVYGYNLWKLRNERLIDYEFDETESNLENSFCLNLNDIFKDRNKIDFKSLKGQLFSYFDGKTLYLDLYNKVSNNKCPVDDVYGHVLKKIKFSKYGEGDSSIVTSFLSLAKRKLDSHDYFIFRNQVCINMDLSTDLNKFFYFKVLPCFNTSFYLYNKETWTFKKFTDISYFLAKTVENLIVSECENEDKNYCKFKCLNDCSKENFKLAKYFYDAREYKDYIDYIDNPVLEINFNKDNESVIESEQKCLAEKCQRNDCILNYFVTDLLKDTNQYSRYTAKPLRSKLDFWILFLGLSLSFYDFSFYQIFKFMFKKLHISEPQIATLNRVLVFSFLCVILGFFCYSIKDYSDKLETPTTKKIMKISNEPQPLELVFCLKFNNSYIGKTFANLEEEIDHLHAPLHRNITIEIERLNNNLESLNCSLKPDVLFKFSNQTLERCFRYSINFKEKLNYRNMLFFSKISIKSLPTMKDQLNEKRNQTEIQLNESKMQIYLIIDQKNFNLKSYTWARHLAFKKYRIKRSSGRNCVDYNRTYSFCDCKWDCIEKCLLHKMFELESKLIEDSVVDKKQFANEWKKKRIFGISKSDDDSLNNITVECEKLFARPDCEETYLESSRKEFNNQISLYYNQVEIKEEEPSLKKIAIDILALLNILFGLYAFKTSKHFLQYILSKLGTDSTNNENQLPLIIVYLKKGFPYFVCLCGISIYSFMVKGEIIYSDLVESQHYKVEDRLSMPQFVFCWNDTRLDESIIFNNMTYADLDDLTADLNASRVFDQIIYLDEFGVWKNLSIDYESKCKSKDCKIVSFYFITHKCFKLKLYQEYRREQFYYQDNLVLKINFNKKHTTSNGKKALFFTIKNDTFYFSRIDYLKFKGMNLTENIGHKKIEYNRVCYRLEEEKVYVNRTDNFKYFKNLKAFHRTFQLKDKNDLYLNDFNNYLKNLVESFKKKHHLTTTYLPNEDKSKFVVNNDLFEKHVEEKQKELEDKFMSSDLDYEREYTFPHFDILFYEQSNTSQTIDNLFDFEFKLNYLQQFIRSTNKNTFQNLILSVINIISLWVFNPFGYCIRNAFSIVKSYFFAADSEYANQSRFPETDYELVAQQSTQPTNYGSNQPTIYSEAINN